MTAFLIATRNAHKVGEIRSILGGDFQLLTLEDFPGAPAVVEDAATFAGNAAKKAEELARWVATQQAPPGGSLREGASFFKPPAPARPAWQVLADDSGLEVDALKGAPGVYSARFAAVDLLKDGNTPDADNNAKLLRLLRDVPAEKRGARFRCVIALTMADGNVAGDLSPTGAVPREPLTALFEGTCEGRIDFAPRGQGGFGYDPLFIPQGFDLSFAQLGEDIKNKLSHRAQALGKLKEWLQARRQVIAKSSTSTGR